MAIFVEKNDNFCQLKKKNQVFGNFLTFNWQFSGGSGLEELGDKGEHGAYGAYKIYFVQYGWKESDLVADVIIGEWKCKRMRSNLNASNF